jgi:hypothetical protein
VTNYSHNVCAVEEALPDRDAPGVPQAKGPPMSYAAPLAYAAKSLTYDPTTSGGHPRPVRQRRRRIRRVLLPALRPR